MVEFVEAFLDIARHGYVNISDCFCDAMVPFQHEDTLFGSGPID